MTKMAINNIDQLWLVSGRCWGDDDDTVSIVEAADEARATDFYIDHLKWLASREVSDDDVWVCHIEPLHRAINDRLKDNQL